MLRWLKLALVLLLASMPAMAAEDDGLYAPPPPAGAAWVRVIGAEDIHLGEHVLSGVAYEMIMQGGFTISHHSTVQHVQIEAGKHYTIAAIGTQPVLLTDPPLENRARAMLVLYNFTDRPALDLITADGQLKVVEGVATQTSGSRMVQPIIVKLAVAVNGQTVKELNELQLQRGESYSIIATGTGDAITAELMQNTTEQPN